MMLHNQIPSSFERWMCFVDGENLTARGQKFARDHELQLVEGPCYARDTFLWLPGLDALDLVLCGPGFSIGHQAAVRAYYYTSLRGDQLKQQNTREMLRKLNFQPEVFTRSKDDTKSKGLDLTIARDILSHGFRNNYDVMVLVAGDGDYVPLLEEVKRLGKISVVAFFEAEGLNPELRLAADYFVEIDSWFLSKWAQPKP